MTQEASEQKGERKDTATAVAQTLVDAVAGDTQTAKDGSAAENNTVSAEAQSRQFTQDDVDRIVAQRLQREKERSEREAAKAREEAEEAALSEQQKYKQLADKRQARVEALEAEALAETERRKRYESVLQQYRDALVDGVPPHVKELLEGRDIADQLEWLTQNLPKIREDQRSPLRIPATPAANSSGKMTQEERRKISFKPRF